MGIIIHPIIITIIIMIIQIQFFKKYNHNNNHNNNTIRIIIQSHGTIPQEKELIYSDIISGSSQKYSNLYTLLILQSCNYYKKYHFLFYDSSSTDTNSSRSIHNNPS